MNFRYLIKAISKFFIRIYENKKLILVLIFCFSILVSFSYLMFFKNIGPEGHKVPGTDYTHYYKPVAESISHGNGIPVREEIGTFYSIGYPLILSVLFFISDILDIEKLRLIMIFNVFITAFAACFLFLFVKSILNKKIAIISSFLWMSYPFNLWLIKNPNTEVPFILIFFIALWAYLLGVKKNSFKFFLVGGALVGFMSLIRPTTIFLPFLLIISIFFIVKKSSFRQKLLFSFILLMAYIIIISPWIIYVYLNTGEIIPISRTGPSAISFGLSLIVDVPEIRGETILPDDVIELINRSKDRNMENFVNITHFFLEELISHPIELLKLVGIKIVRSWHATSSVWWEKEILLVQLLYLIPAIGGIGIYFKKNKKNLSYILFLLTIILYFWLATVVALSILRYMLPIMALVMIFSSITISFFIDKIVKKFKESPNEA